MSTMGLQDAKAARLHHPGPVLHFCLQRRSSLKALQGLWCSGECAFPAGAHSSGSFYTFQRCAIFSFSDDCFRQLQENVQICIAKTTVGGTNLCQHVSAICLGDRWWWSHLTEGHLLAC